MCQRKEWAGRREVGVAPQRDRTRGLERGRRRAWAGLTLPLSETDQPQRLQGWHRQWQTPKGVEQQHQKRKGQRLQKVET